MHFRNMALLLPFTLLAACGSSGSTDAPTTAAPETATTDATTAALPAPTETTAADGAAPAAAVATVAAAAPPEFAICRTCHSPEKDKNGGGPSLFGIVGSKAGEVPNYAFSPALKASGIVWTPEKLDTWLQGPMKMVPGTKMVIAVPDAAKRKAIITYLETLK